MNLQDINLNLLKTFYNVAKEGSITKTAEKYYTSQPAISRAIKQLESEYNTKLFYRTLTGVKLTEKGNILFNSIEKIFENMVQTEAQIKDVDGFEKGKLVIGAPSQIAAIYIFEAIAKFHKVYPQVEITIISKTTTELLKLLQKHEVDFVIDSAPISTNLKNFEIKNITEFDNCFFVNSKFPQTEIQKIKNLSDLKDLPLILPIPKTANRNALDDLLKEKNVVFSNILNIHTSEMIISAVKNDTGVGYTLKDLILGDVKNGELSILELKEDLPKIKICLVYETNTLNKLSLHFLNNFLKIYL